MVDDDIHSDSARTTENEMEEAKKLVGSRLSSLAGEHGMQGRQPRTPQESALFAKLAVKALEWVSKGLAKEQASTWRRGDLEEMLARGAQSG